MKYMYLLFGPNDVLPLDKVVFNTEAHAFPHFELGKLFKTGWKRKPRDAQGNIVAARSETPVTEKVQEKAKEAVKKIETVKVKDTVASVVAEVPVVASQALDAVTGEVKKVVAGEEKSYLG